MTMKVPKFYNPKHEPDEVSRAEVTALASFGNTQEDIATYLEITVDTLVKYYRRELDNAAIHANAVVAKKLYNKAVEQDDFQAQQFWLKTRAKWRTTDSDVNLNITHEQILKELE